MQQNNSFFISTFVNIHTHIDTSVASVEYRDDFRIGSPYVEAGTTTRSGDENEEKIYKVRHLSSYKNVAEGKATVDLRSNIVANKWNIIAAGFVKLNNKDSNTAGSQRYFTKLPYLETEFKDNLKLVIRRKTKLKSKDGSKEYENITECFFSILYRNFKNINRNKPIECSIKYTAGAYNYKLAYVNPEIHNIDFGRTSISRMGENRQISIHGDPGATWGLAINESFEKLSANTSVGHNEALKYINKGDDVSLLLQGLKRNAKLDYYIGPYGKEMPILRGTIGENGFSVFNQFFPSNIIKRTLIDGDVSTDPKVAFDNLGGVKEGDRIHADQIDSETIVTVSALNPDNDNINECNLSSSVTLTSRKNAYFTRNRIYSIDVIPEFTSGYKFTVGGQDEHGQPLGDLNGIQYRIDQPSDIIVTWRMSGNAAFAITHNNGVVTGKGAGSNFDVKVSGIPGSKLIKKTAFSLLVDLDNAAHTFSAISAPIVNQRSPSNSSFGTTGLVMNNYGTRFRVKGFSFSAVGSNTITIDFELWVLEFGTESVQIDLDLNSLLSYS